MGLFCESSSRVEIQANEKLNVIAKLGNSLKETEGEEEEEVG